MNKGRPKFCTEAVQKYAPVHARENNNVKKGWRKREGGRNREMEWGKGTEIGR